MPVTTSSHPLAKLRGIIGWTREDCASVAGMTAANIQNVELGRTKLSEEAAFKIQAATGCLHSSLLTKRDRPSDLQGRDYSRKTFENWTRFEVSQDEFQKAMDDYTFRVRMLLIASKDQPWRFRRLCVRMHQIFMELPDEVGITQGDLLNISRGGSETPEIKIQEMTFREVYEFWDTNPKFDEFIKGKPIEEWAKKKCKTAIRAFRLYPNLTMQGALNATSYLMVKQEWDIVFPDSSSLSLGVITSNIQSIGYDTETTALNIDAKLPVTPPK